MTFSSNSLPTVVAIGGNALSDGGGGGEAAGTAAVGIAALAADGVPLVITHGNGPQVGRALLRSAAAEPDLPPLPMDVAVAHTQGEIGYLLVNALEGALRSRGLSVPVIAVVTRTLVAADDPAFRTPNKPIGPWMVELQAQRLARLRSWSVKRIGARGWRRVVASPNPIEILEAETIRTLVAAGAIVICAGGGGVPVTRVGECFSGVEAVVDKDHASAVLADAIDADHFVLATDVPGVALNHGKDDELWLKSVSTVELQSHLDAGQFPAGSMAPKVTAAMRFMAAPALHHPRHASITSLSTIREAREGTKGTTIL